MQIRVWGCRGSLASPGPDTVRYGGNTSSVEVRLEDGTLIILDAGTGIRDARTAHRRPPDAKAQPDPAHRDGYAPVEPIKKINLFLSHLHLDHVEGIGFFSALWNPDVELHVWGPPSPLRSLQDRIATLMSPAAVPRPPRGRAVPADLSRRPGRGDADRQRDGLRAAGGAPRLDRRLSASRRTDERSRTSPTTSRRSASISRRSSREWVSGFSVAQGADVLFHDSQYTEDEYPNHRAWGHSSIAHTVTFGQMTKAKELVLFHHDPAHSDEQLEMHLKRATRAVGRAPTARPSSPTRAWRSSSTARSRRSRPVPRPSRTARPARSSSAAPLRSCCGRANVPRRPSRAWRGSAPDRSGSGSRLTSSPRPSPAISAVQAAPGNRRRRHDEPQVGDLGVRVAEPGVRPVDDDRARTAPASRCPGGDRDGRSPCRPRACVCSQSGGGMSCRRFCRPASVAACR